mgnify:FL=1
MKDKKAIKKIMNIIEKVAVHDNDCVSYFDMNDYHVRRRMKRKEIVQTIDSVIDVLNDDTGTYTKEDALDLLVKVRNNTL